MSSPEGGSEAHAFVRDSALPRTDTPGLDDYGLASAQAAVDAELELWKSLCWMPSSGYATMRPLCPAGPLLAPITAAELGKALLSFAWPTGLGAGQTHLRHLYYASQAGKNWLRILLTLIEGCSVLPSSQKVMVFNLVGKPDGGTRLIALLGSLYRVWTAARMPLVQQWASQYERPYFFASAGKGSSDAVADQLFEDEAALADGLDSCSVMLDL